MKKTGTQRVLIIPALAPKISGKSIYFLFTLQQIEDIFREEAVRQIPFSPFWIRGLTCWRDHALPVICLEDCLGLPVIPAGNPGRMVVVRSRGERAVLYAGTALRLIPLPEIPAPLESVPWISEKHLVRNVYEWTEGFLILADMEKILEGQTDRMQGQQKDGE